MPTCGAGHGGWPYSRVSAGPQAVPMTDCNAVDKHEHAEDQMFVDMLPGDNSPSDVEDYSEDLHLLASPSPQRRRPKAQSHCWHLHSRVHGWSAVSAELSKLEHTAQPRSKIWEWWSALLSITLYTGIAAPCTIT